MQNQHSGSTNDVAPWDMPIRLFHGSIVVLIGLAWWSAEARLLDWHRRAGYAILCLLIFRILWGFFGSPISRFASFCKTPAQVFRYVRNEMFSQTATPAAGHNPLGGWSVMAMLATMLLQAVLGLLAVDVDGMESGPLSYLVSFDAGRVAAATHHHVFNVLLSLSGLHIAAIAFYHIHKKQNLTKRMFTARSTAADLSSRSLFSRTLLAVTLFSWSVLFVVFLTTIVGR